MTKEEAINRLRNMTIEISDYCNASKHMSEADRQDMETFDMAIKALEQEPVLDKLRAEIAELDVYYDNDYFSDNKDAMFKCNDVLQILDKYKGESEE